MFEWVYFARPDSMIEKRAVYNARLRLGELLAKKINKKRIIWFDVSVKNYQKDVEKKVNAWYSSLSDPNMRMVSELSKKHSQTQ